MKAKHVISAALIHFTVLSASANAAMISLSPSSASVGVGHSVSFDLVVSGLGSDILTSFDLDFSFDSSILSYDSFTFGDPINGNQLDLSGTAGGILQSIDSSLGSVSVADVSFDPDSLLLSSQLDDFVLGTFSFTALSLGTTSLGLQNGLLGGVFDINFVAQPISFTSESASITVGALAVSSPISVLLFALGISVLLFSRKKQR